MQSRSGNHLTAFSNSGDKVVMVGYFLTFDHGSTSNVPGTEVQPFQFSYGCSGYPPPPQGNKIKVIAVP
jgi:hypothetical protein